MFKISLNELIALQMILEDVTVADLLSAASESFSKRSDVRAKEIADTCIKALETFLR